MLCDMLASFFFNQLIQKANESDLANASVFEFDSHLKPDSKKRKTKLITSRELRKLEDNCWHELAEDAEVSLSRVRNPSW